MIEMVEVPQSGPVVEEIIDRRRGRIWTVEVRPFLVAPTVVTAGLWEQVLGLVPDPASATLPKVEVTWHEAIAFCNRISALVGRSPAYVVTRRDEDLGPAATWTPHNEPAPDQWDVQWDRSSDGYRLLTDAEWQVACRAGTTGPRYADLDEIAWYAGNSGNQRHPVATRTPNDWGLHDTLGGVWEWCWDRYDEDVYGAYRIIRGGGWNDPEWSCRAGVRRTTNPHTAFDDLGFRLARTLNTSREVRRFNSP